MIARQLLRSLLAGAALSSGLVVLPLAGNAAMLGAAHPWILLALGILASVLQPPYNPFTIVARSIDRGTGAQIIWSVCFTQLAAVLEAGYLRYPQSIRWDSVAEGALAVALLGLALRTWAVFTLGGLFTMHLAVACDQRIVATGPYAFVRHPGYLGALLLYLGTAAFLHAWFSVAVAAIVLPLAFVRRILVEERLLRQERGAEYESYASRVCRLVPGIW